MRNRLFVLLAFVSSLSAMVSTSALAAGGSAVCKGRFINPVTDVCWSCIFPIKLGSAVTLPDAATNASPICACGRGIKRRVGVNMSYWEPVRTAEIVSARPRWVASPLGTPHMRAQESPQPKKR